MAVTYVASNIANNGSGTTVTVSTPTHSSGNLLIIAVSGTENAPTYAAPSGWSTFFQLDQASHSTGNMALYYKIAGASEPTSVSISSSVSTNMTACMVSFSGVDTVSPMDVYGITYSTDTSRTKDTAPSVSATNNNSYVLRIWSQIRTYTSITKPVLADDIATYVSALPTYSNHVDMVAMGQLQAASGATGISELTITNPYRSASVTVTINSDASTPTATNGLKYYNGTAWVGTPTNDGVLKHYNGTTWVDVEY